MASLEEVREALAAALPDIADNDAVTDALAGLDWSAPTAEMFAQSEAAAAEATAAAVAEARAELRARWWAGQGPEGDAVLTDVIVDNPGDDEEDLVAADADISIDEIFGTAEEDKE